MKLKNYYSLLFILLLLACDKKEYPKDRIEESEATFFSSLIINGSPLTLEAGKNGYYMYSKYQQDSNGVYGFIGELSPNGTNKPNSLVIQVNDSKISANNEASNINASLIPGSYRFYDASYSSTYGVEFESTYNRTPKTYAWDFGDGIKSTAANPIHYFKNSGVFSSCLSIEGTNFCQSTMCNPITIGSNAFNAFISGSNLSDSIVSFSASTFGGKAPYTYWWTFGDGGTSPLSNPNHSYLISGSYPVKLRITDADSKTINLSYNVVTGADRSSCASNIKIKSILPSINNSGLSEVLVSFTDASGKIFSSHLNSQLSSSLFTIVSVQDFENNENGEKTKKIKLNFNCKLYSGTETMTLEGSDCIICVAYK